MVTFIEQMNNLAKSWGYKGKILRRSDILNPFKRLAVQFINEVIHNSIYIYIESEPSFRDDTDDYFKWRFITEDEKIK